MTEYVLPRDLEQQLEVVAQREQRSQDEVLQDAVRQYLASQTILNAVEDEDENKEIPPVGTLAHLAYLAERNPISSGHTDTGARADEILNDEFADYLISRQQNQNNDAVE